MRAYPTAPPQRHVRPVAWIAAFTALSWAGEYAHNRVDLPHLSVLSPENSVPALIALTLFLAWWWRPFSRLPRVALLGWTLVQLVGGIISVLPLGFLPFSPEQTVQHYLMHVVYASAQVPLIIALLRQL
jgi:hypothetical protein